MAAPANATNLNRSATSSDTSVATVEHTGTWPHKFTIRGVSAGTSTIRIFFDDDPSIYLEKVITVTDPRNGTV